MALTPPLYVPQTNGALGEAVWRRLGNQGSEWLQARVSLPALDTASNVVLEGVRGDGWQGDIAIDDVSVEEGLCGAPKGGCFSF